MLPPHRQRLTGVMFQALPVIIFSTGYPEPQAGQVPRQQRHQLVFLL
jgi:hypothetical protein